MSIRFFSISAAFLLLSACTDTNVIRIGYIGPLTGDAVSYGVDTLHGVELAVRQINARGGVRGKQVELIVEDGRCTPSDALNAATKLIDADHVAAIIGGNCSTETLAVAPKAEASKTVLLSPISSSAKITDAGDYVFRVYPSGAYTGSMYAKFFSGHAMKKIALLSEDTDYCRGLQSAILKNLPEGSIIAFNETVEPGTKDFRTLLTRLRNKDFDVLALQVQSDAAVEAFIKQYDEFGIGKPLVGNDVAESNVLSKLAEVEGMHIIAVTSPNLRRPQAADFIAQYRKMYGEPKQNFFYPALAYDAANILLESMQKADSGPSLRDALYGLQKYAGVMGDLSFDSKGDVRGVGYGFKEWRNGEVVQQSAMMP